MEKKQERDSQDRSSCQSRCEQSFLTCVESGRLDCIMIYKSCSNDCSL